MGEWVMDWDTTMVELVSCVCCVMDQDLSSCPFLYCVYELTPATNRGGRGKGKVYWSGMCLM